MTRNVPPVTTPPGALFSLSNLRTRATAREITTTAHDGTEIVWCGEQNGEYVGWTPRETAEANGYEVHKTESNPGVLALVEAVEAAVPMARLPFPVSSDERDDWRVYQQRLREKLEALDE